mmetsp:Transcript_14669/g.27836  ORF Transcript_14669/g.27836 Transcript_14669/m.27836 type:complete len:158 (-) Transcript_14669:249-722(-)
MSFQYCFERVMTMIQVQSLSSDGLDQFCRNDALWEAFVDGDPHNAIQGKDVESGQAVPFQFNLDGYIRTSLHTLLRFLYDPKRSGCESKGGKVDMRDVLMFCRAIVPRSMAKILEQRVEQMLNRDGMSLENDDVYNPEKLAELFYPFSERETSSRRR